MKTFDEICSEIGTPERPAAGFYHAVGEAQERRVVLYGAGGNCQFALFTLSLLTKIKVSCICDSRQRGVYIYEHSNGSTSKYPIISPARLVTEYRDALVCITTWKYEGEIRDYLLHLGFPEEQIFYLRSPCVMSFTDFREKYMDGYRWAYDTFTDTCSKQKVIDRVKYHLLGEACPPDALCAEGCFTHPCIQFRDGEVFVDGGAYIGDTAEEFVCRIKAAGKRYSHIYSFEPDPHNLKIAEKNLAPYRNIDLVPAGLWSKKGTLPFTSACGGDFIASSITDAPAEKDALSVNVTSLDTFFKEKPEEEWPTLIKMDIEGAEKEALLGAAEIIRKKKPKLILSAYHKPEDIYELPQTILRLRSDYQMTLWQIGESYWDTDLYAV